MLDPVAVAATIAALGVGGRLLPRNHATFTRAAAAPGPTAWADTHDIRAPNGEQQ